jgi:hypothetical protein
MFGLVGTWMLEGAEKSWIVLSAIADDEVMSIILA